MVAISRINEQCGSLVNRILYRRKRCVFCMHCIQWLIVHVIRKMGCFCIENLWFVKCTRSNVTHTQYAPSGICCTSTANLIFYISILATLKGWGMSSWTKSNGHLRQSDVSDFCCYEYYFYVMHRDSAEKTCCLCM